jgi:hypothetical protein
LHEVGDPGTARCDIPEAHLLEYDADQSALMLACKVQTEGAENITGLLAMPLTQRLHLTLFAAYIVSLILAQWARLFPFMVNAASHPPATHRLANQVRTVASAILPLTREAKTANTAAFDDLRKLSALVPVFPTVDTVVTDPDALPLHDALNKAQDELHALRELLRRWEFTLYDNQSTMDAMKKANIQNTSTHLRGDATEDIKQKALRLF